MQDFLQEKINFEKKRDFGDLLNSTFNFIKQEFKTLKKPLFTVIFPITLAVLLICNIAMYFLYDIVVFSSANIFVKQTVAYISTLGSSILIFVLDLFVYGYIKDYNENGGEANAKRAWAIGKENLFQSFGMTFLSGLLVLVGIVCLLVPGIYFAVTVTLVIPVIFFDREGGTEAITKSRALIKGNWWFTLGVIIVFGIIIQILRTVVSIPLIAYSAIIAQHTISNVSHVTFAPPLPFYLLNALIESVIVLITLAMPVLFSLNYFNLRERNEATSLIDRINKIDAAEKAE